jgi:hypothetical protein
LYKKQFDSDCFLDKNQSTGQWLLGSDRANPREPHSIQPMRQIAVETHHEARRVGGRFKTTQGAKIRLKGKWLEEAGFPPGAIVTVIAAAPGELVIRTKEADDRAWMAEEEAKATARLELAERLTAEIEAEAGREGGVL